MAEVYPHDDYNADYHEFIEKLNTSEENENDSTASFDSSKTTPQYHVQKAEMAMHNLKFVVRELGWKKVLLHKCGITVYSKPGITRGDQIPVFMGEHVIEGFTPRAVFAVIGMRKLWDDWYEEGSLVENLNDTTSLTYMVMQALAGSKTRDLSLVEKIECAQNGAIYFIATSVETPKVPRVYNRIRAHLNLNGWILEPLSYDPPKTKVTYVLQTKIKGWVPSILSKTYLARRPLVLYTIDQYLQRNGALPITGTPPESVRPSRAQSDTSSTYQDNHNNNNNHNNNTPNFEVKYPRKKISFTNLNNVPLGTPINPIQTTIQTTEEIQNDYFPHQDEPIISPFSPSPPQAISPPQATFLPQATSLPRTISPLRTISPPPRTISPPPQTSSPPRTTTPPRITTPPRTSSPLLPLSSTIHTEKSQPKKSVEPVRHRHTASLEGALKLFRSHLPLTDWNFHSESKGIKIHMKDSGRSTPILRGDGVISGGFTTYDILSVIKNIQLWDDGFDDGATYEIFSLHEQLIRTSMKGIFPISGRDFSTCGMLSHDEENTGILQFVGVSVVDPLIPEIKKYVRANLGFVGWQLKPNFDVDGNTTSVDVVYIADIDIKLDIIPSSIRKMLSVQIPTNVAKVNGYMQKNGFPPYVLDSTAKIEKDFSDKNGQYKLLLIAEEGGVTEFKLSKLMFPNGVEVSTIPEDCKVELLSNSSEIIRVTFPRKIDLDVLTITISKHSKGSRMTYNHGRTIPTVSTVSDIEKPVEITKSISAQPKHATTSTDATLVANEAIDSRVINNEPDNMTGSDKINKKNKRPPKNRKSSKSSAGSRSIITSKIFVSPAEVPLKSDPYQRLLEKQTLLENKIAAITRDSRRDFSLLEIKGVTEESNNDLSFSEVKEDLQVSNNDITPLEVKQSISDDQKSNNDLTPLRVKPEDKSQALNDDLSPLEKTKLKTDQPHDEVSPLEKYQMDKVIKDNSFTLSSLGFITDSFRFNAQQIGLIFASMLLAYYAGKLSI